MMSNDSRPPRLARKLLLALLREDLAEEVDGDLEEKFLALTRNRSLRRAKLNYWYQVLQYIRPFALRKSGYTHSNSFVMLPHYFKIAWRNMIRDKSYFLINTLGLALSMFCAMLIILWISDELSYENFVPESKQVYRLVQNQEQNGEVFKVAANPGILPLYLKEKYSGIKSFTRFRPLADKVLVRYEDTRLYDEVTYVDSTFFEVFQLPFIMGNPKNALMDPNSAVITEQVAEKYFGPGWRGKNILGKTLTVDKNAKFEISGVIKDLPSNTHLRIRVLLPMRKLYQDNWYLGWGNNYYYCYFMLDEGADPKTLSAQFSAFGKTRNDLTDILYLQSLEDIHLYSDFDIDVYGSTEPQYPYVKVFTVIAIGIIIIACINFMNLSTARSEKRAKEIGLRKTVGSLRSQIVVQLLSESVLMTFIALAVAWLGVIVALPAFNHIADKSITFELDKWRIALCFLGGALVIGLLAGSYPALYLSGFKPARILKGRFSMTGGGTTFRRALVVVQFSVTIMLFIGTAIIYKQFQYFMEKDLGYDKDLLLYLPARGDILKNYDVFKNELIQHQLIKGVTRSSDIPTYTVHSFGGFDWTGKDPDSTPTFHSFSIGMDYVETLGLELVGGRSFLPTDTANYILNEEAIRITGLKSPVGERFNMWGVEGKIVGVVKNFNFKSLHQKVEPLVMRLSPGWDAYVMVRIAPGNTLATVDVLEDAWQQANPEFPMEYHFMNDQYETLYRSEARMATVFDYFTAFTLFIACLGLIGLINHMIEKRRKEISIRKVHGASSLRILGLLSREYVQLIVIALVISIPGGAYMVYQWLEGYAYRISIPWWLYAVPGLVVLAVVMVFVGAQTFKAARRNPVDSLRYE